MKTMSFETSFMTHRTISNTSRYTQDITNVKVQNYALSLADLAGLQFAVRTAVAQWLRCCATNLKVAGSIPDGVIGIFH